MKILFFKEGKPMSKKKKIFILVSMVLLLVVTGYLNVALNKKSNVLDSTTTTANFFESSRADKTAARNYQLEILQNVYDSTTDEAERASVKQQILDIAAMIETENNLEQCIASAGFEDVIVTCSGENYTVYVKTDEGLTGDEVASILSVLVRETNAQATNIRVRAVA